MTLFLSALTAGLGVVLLAVIGSIAITWAAYCSDVKTNWEDDDNQ